MKSCHVHEERETHSHPHSTASQSTPTVPDQSLLPLVSSVSSVDSVAMSMAAVFLANVSPKLQSTDENLKNGEQSENVFHSCSAVVDSTGIEPQFVIHENEHVL